MAKLDTNLDACQLSSEILIRLRKMVRETLRGAYGKTWEENGIPAEIRDYLTQRQAREASINWNLSDSVDVLDFAGYVNLYDIISATPNLLERFLPLAPDAHVLRIRFLELDTILNRIAYARPISEADLGFLVSFEDRVKKTSGAPAPPPEPAPPAPPARAAARPAPAGPLGEPKPQAGPRPAAEPAHAPASGRRAARSAPVAPPPEPEPVPVETAPLAEAPSEAPAAPPAAEPPQPAAPPPVATLPLIGLQEVTVALKKGDNKTVLTALYQEVTALADGLWNGSVASLKARTWEQVRESQWYNDRFAKLGLKSISDFFGLFDAAKEKMLAGTGRAELQEFLKEHSFVQVLLALKDLFRQHMKP